MNVSAQRLANVKIFVVATVLPLRIKTFLVKMNDKRTVAEHSNNHRKKETKKESGRMSVWGGQTERQTGRQTDREIQQQHATGVSANKIRRCLSPCIFRCSGCTSISVSKHQGQEFNPTPLFDTTYACVWHGAYLAIRLTNLLPSRLVIQTAE